MMIALALAVAAPATADPQVLLPEAPANSTAASNTAPANRTAAASNTSSWCEALHQLVLTPLGLRRTYCQRNDIPAVVASEHRTPPATDPPEGVV